MRRGSSPDPRRDVKTLEGCTEKESELPSPSPSPSPDPRCDVKTLEGCTEKESSYVTGKKGLGADG